jgi:hypothetical protein
MASIEQYSPCEEHLKEVTRDGHALKNVPHEQRTREIFLAAVGQNGHALQYIGTEQTYEIIFMACKQNPYSFMHTLSKFTSDIEFMMMMCQHFQNAFSFADNLICYDVRLMVTACRPFSRESYGGYVEMASFYSYRQQINNVFSRISRDRIKDMSSTILTHIQHIHNDKLMARWLIKNIIDAHPVLAKDHQVINKWRSLFQLPKANTNNMFVSSSLTTKFSALYQLGQYLFFNVMQKIMSYLNPELFTFDELYDMNKYIGPFNE